MKYNWILFDADETLFSFDSFSGLKQLFTHYNVDFTQEDFIEYQQLNKPLWVAYQDGKIDAKTLQEQRFSEWGKRLSVKPAELNHGFLVTMAEVCRPLEGVVELLQQLQHRAKLAIITNGFTAMQKLRLQKTGLSDYFEFVVVSEEIGVSKPNPDFFITLCSWQNHDIVKKYWLWGIRWNQIFLAVIMLDWILAGCIMAETTKLLYHRLIK